MKRCFLKHIFFIFLIAGLSLAHIDFSSAQSRGKNQGARSGSSENIPPPPPQETQSQDQSPATEERRSDNKMATIPDAYLEETDEFYNYCENDANMNQYYDCECLSIKFLDHRIDLGPDISRRRIMLRIQKECPDATNAAGYEYGQCLSKAPLLPAGVKPEKYCECYANKYAELFERFSPGTSAKTRTKLQTRAHIECRKRGTIETLYPD